MHTILLFPQKKTKSFANGARAKSYSRFIGEKKRTAIAVTK
jgi:hypothetical protein